MLAGEFGEVFVQPNGPVSGRGKLLPLQVQKLIRRHILGQNIPAVLHQNSRENQAVEDNVVLADEVHQAGVLILPPFFPIGPKELLGGRDITDGRVKPHVQHLAVGAFHGNGNAPVEVAGHASGLQAIAGIQPRLALAVDVGLPFGVGLDVGAQFRRQLVQRQEPIGRLAHLRSRTRKCRHRVDQIRGIQGRSTLLALVAVGPGCLALGAGARDIAVRQKLLRFGIVVLVRFTRFKHPFFVERLEEIARHFGMLGRRGARINVKLNAKLCQRIPHHLMVAVHNLAGGDALFSGLHGNRHTVLVRSTYKGHLFALEAEVAHIDVRRQVTSR